MDFLVSIYANVGRLDFLWQSLQHIDECYCLIKREQKKIIIIYNLDFIRNGQMDIFVYDVEKN